MSVSLILYCLASFAIWAVGSANALGDWRENLNSDHLRLITARHAFKWFFFGFFAWPVFFARWLLADPVAGVAALIRDADLPALIPTRKSAKQPAQLSITALDAEQGALSAPED